LPLSEWFASWHWDWIVLQIGCLWLGPTYKRVIQYLPHRCHQLIINIVIVIIIIINNKHPLSIIIHILQTWSSQEMSTQHNKSCGKMFKV
jgi:hypothetical protein